MAFAFGFVGRDEFKVVLLEIEEFCCLSRLRLYGIWDT